jgi:hypothetical protein
LYAASSSALTADKFTFSCDAWTDALVPKDSLGGLTLAHSRIERTLTGEVEGTAVAQYVM